MQRCPYRNCNVPQRHECCVRNRSLSSPVAPGLPFSHDSSITGTVCHIPCFFLSLWTRFFFVCNFDAYLYAGQPAPFFAFAFFFPWDHNLCQWLRCQICAGVCTYMSLGGGGVVAAVHSLRNWPWVVNGEWENSFGRGTSCGYPTTGIRRLNIWSLTEFLSRFIIYGDEKRFLLMKCVVLGWPPQASQDQVALPSSQPRLFLAPGVCLIREERRL